MLVHPHDLRGGEDFDAAEDDFSAAEDDFLFGDVQELPWWVQSRAHGPAHKSLLFLESVLYDVDDLVCALEDILLCY